MADRHEETARRMELAAKYTVRLRERDERLKSRLSPEQYDFFKGIRPAGGTSLYAELTAALRDPAVVPSEYLSRKFGWLFDEAIPGREKDVVLYFADRLREYPYSDSYMRRSFRAGSNGVYAAKLANIIREYGRGTMDPVGAPPEKVLNRELPEETQAYLDQYAWNGCGYTGWQIAYALDHRDGAVEEAVRRILTEENSSAMMTRALVRGVLISHRSDFHELLGKLLLAAGTQEGLRQVICENADCGTKAGFFTLLRVIDENHLIRFSAVKRAVGTWLGILPEESRDLERVSEKTVHLVVECLGPESESVREEYLASEDAMKIYVSLWSYGLDDIEASIRRIARIADEGSTHQLLTAGYFAANIDQPKLACRIAGTVLKRPALPEEVTAVWLPCFMSDRTSVLYNARKNDRPLTYDTWFDSPEEAGGYYRLIRGLYAAFSGKTKIFSPCVFPWYEAKLSRSDFAELICTLAALSGDREKTDEACALVKDCDADQRQTYFTALLCRPRTDLQRRTVLEGLADKESGTRKSAFEIASGLKLTAEEYRFIEDHLRYKNPDIRKNVPALLLKQKDDALAACISRLLESEKEEVRFAGLDLLVQLKKDPRRGGIADAFAPRLSEKAGSETLSAREKTLIGTLLPAEATDTAEDAPLFTPADRYCPTEFDADHTALCVRTFEEYFPDSALPGLLRGTKHGAGLLGKLRAALAENTACPSAVQAAADLLSLSRYIEAHKTDTYIGPSGEETLVGNLPFAHQFIDRDGKLPLAELWQAWFRDNGINGKRLVRAMVLFCACSQQTDFAKNSADLIRSVLGTGFETGRELPHRYVMQRILTEALGTLPEEDRTRLGSALTLWFIRCVPDDRVMIPDPQQHRFPGQTGAAHLLAHPQLALLYGWLKCGNDAELKNTFPLAVASAERCMEAVRRLPPQPTNGFAVGGPVTRTLWGPLESLFYRDRSLIGANAYLFAAHQGLITDAQLYEFLLRPEGLRESLSVVTAAASSCYENGKQISGRDSWQAMRSARKVKEFLGKEGDPTGEDRELLDFVVRVYETVIPVVLASELRRGDSPAAYSAGIRGIARVYGAENLARILSALGNDTIDRTAYYGWGGSDDRRGTLSYLLSVCIPAEGDSAETLKAALDGRRIPKKRLIEAALFSPEWIPLIGSYLDIGAFEPVCYYFMAHMNEKFDDKRRAMIARFTPLSEEELNLGAFDRNWFLSAYAAIGEKDFDLIYDAAKYISDGARHSRARKYADAALGRLDADKTQQTVTEKRNKDLLMAYALIPLTGEEDLCARYLYIQKYRRESRQFGAQRAAGESRAADTALLNLAINAGYADVTRLTLRMETRVIDESRELMEEQLIDSVSLRIVTDENGKAALRVCQDGKQLKSVPEKLKKNERVRAMTDLVKTLTEQYRRTRLMLEQAMEDGTAFTFGELSALTSHPVVYPMLKNLVLIGPGAKDVGFLSAGGLSDAAGNVHSMAEGAELRVAHPFDLYARGYWREYQKYLFDNRITQPFRQVFRELYIKTPEEAEYCHSLRYAGNQIQPAKTVGVLKGRRWVADVEDGLQKVYYKENVVARIYALADWFSPADIEAPTLEWVCFTDRKTGRELRIGDVPDVLFSEVMRDVDLAVSVAHAGGVDPETSHSTMEMRASLLSFVLPMFGVNNVRVEGRHALIDGKLAEYSVHLGSGVVHQLGGTMIPVLPVHSQHRGKIFLPFADEDPKTAEILSKVLLFAEDNKIRDPMILANIQKRM